MDINWKKISEEKHKIGYRNIIKRKYKLPNGTTHDYDIVEMGPAACALALTKNNKVITLKIFRPGPDKILLELPGGLIEKGSTAEETIKKEFLEETGYSGEFKLVSSTYEDAYSTMLRYHFVGINCEKVQDQKLEEREGGLAEVVLFSIEEFKKHLKSGDLTDPETGYIGLIELGLLEYSH
ncbi:NUDIX hydrolase [Patescibacteria group bacterium]